MQLLIPVRKILRRFFDQKKEVDNFLEGTEQKKEFTKSEVIIIYNQVD